MSNRRRGPVDDDSEISDSDSTPRNLSWPVVLKTGQKVKNEEEDSYTESSSNESENSSILSDAEYEVYDDGFVVDSDDNLNSRAYTNSNKRRRRTNNVKQKRAERAQQRVAKRRKRARSVSSNDQSSDEFDVSEGSIVEELRELQNEFESPQRRRNFRARQPVNYMIPPPPTIEEVAKEAEEKIVEVQNQKKDRRLRRLFEVSGPFGGHDVHTIFAIGVDELSKTIKQVKSKEVGGGGPGGLGPGSHDSGQNLGPGGPAPGGAPGAPGGAPAGNDADIDPIEISGVDFSMVGGLDSYIAKLKEMVSLPLLYPEVYEKFGITPPRGVLFHGPPGTGKTLMARALAASHKEEKVTFYMRKGADILSKWIGESERQLRALFDNARLHQPSIIFFDEIDGLAPVRSAKQEQHHASIVSTLLALMDGMDNRGQVVVIGATNRPDSVDPALRRPGRFDREFYFPLPDFQARIKILEIHTRQWSPPPSNELLKDIAKQTKGFGGADLRALCTEAALLAINRAYPQIYKSNAKLQLDLNSITVQQQDFTLALQNLKPSTMRTAQGTVSQPLPARVEPLLRETFNNVKELLLNVFPTTSTKESQQSALRLNNEMFSNALKTSEFRSQSVCKPKILLTGRPGNGQQYITKAIANMLEGVYIRELSLSSLFSANFTLLEQSLVNCISEVRQRAPSCLLVSNLSEFHSQPHLIVLMSALLKSIAVNEKVLVVLNGEDVQNDTNMNPIIELFDGNSIDVVVNTSKEVLNEFFKPVYSFIKTNPVKCLLANELPFKQPPKLPVITPKNDIKHDKVEEVSQPFSLVERRELRIRSQLKIKLGLILDGFRQKYRRFRKPVIDEMKLVHLFEPNLLEEDDVVSFVVDDGMILDKLSGKRFYNMDLETVEDRLWNGFYCLPQQFLHDIDLIYKDAVVSGERERMHKASEMLANAQVAIDEIEMDRSFMIGCESVYLKDLETRLEKELREQREREEQEEREQREKEEQKEEQEEKEEEQDMKVENDVETTDAPSAPSPPAPSPPAPPLSPQMEVENVIAEEIVSEPAPVVSLEEYNKLKTQEVTIDETEFTNFQNELLESTSQLTLDELEALYASLTDVAFRHRSEWDRNVMVKALRSTLKQKIN